MNNCCSRFPPWLVTSTPTKLLDRFCDYESFKLIPPLPFPPSNNHLLWPTQSFSIINLLLTFFLVLVVWSKNSNIWRFQQIVTANWRKLSTIFRHTKLKQGNRLSQFENFFTFVVIWIRSLKDMDTLSTNNI